MINHIQKIENIVNKDRMYLNLMLAEKKNSISSQIKPSNFLPETWVLDFSNL